MNETLIISTSSSHHLYIFGIRGMSSLTVSSLALVSKQVSIYMGIPMLIAGVLGGFFSMVVFLSLKTFRQSSCTFFLMIMSCANIGQLLTALLTRILITGFNIDGTETSQFYCKFRVFCIQSCALISFTCYCLATIDQYFATCSRPRWQQWCHIQIACRLSIIFSVIWLMHGIPFLLYYQLMTDSNTERSLCTVIHPIFLNYTIYLYPIFFRSSAPLLISLFFGFLAYRNVQQIRYRTIPLVRRELDKQLTRMVLSQVLLNIFIFPHYTITSLILLHMPLDADRLVLAILQLMNTIALHLYYVYYAVSFSSCCSS